MMLEPSVIQREKGFTLVEILVTIVFAAILAAVLFQFLGSSMTQSSSTASAGSTHHIAVK